MARESLKIAMVDDHVMFRETLKSFLLQQTDLRVTVERSNAADLFGDLQKNSVDILLMDLFLPDLNGYEALKIIKSEYPDIKTIVLSMNTDLVLINSLLDIGIQGYVSKTDEPQSLLQAIYAASENKLHRSKLVTEALYHHRLVNSRRLNGTSPIVFDEREIRVLQLLWAEKSNKEIAGEIFLSVRSIEKLRQDMKEKVGAKSTIGLLKYALCHHVIEFEKTYIPVIENLVKTSLNGKNNYCKL
jgi:DNA-binding NarL/FixJ family response regulator